MVLRQALQRRFSAQKARWKGARPGKIFEMLVHGAYAYPVMVVDEIDKARGEHAFEPLGALCAMLEHDIARTFTDELAEVSIGASRLIRVATANDERSIPEPILNRMNVVELRAPDRDAARTIALRPYRSIRAEHDRGRRFDDVPIDAVPVRLSGLAPREMRRAWMTAFGDARLECRVTPSLDDLPDANSRRATIGFTD